jgi:hypothetical protein
VELLKKGFDHSPERWEYLEDIGFVYYWSLQDYESAAAWFKKAAEIPGAPTWMAPLAATTLAEGGSRQSSRQLWTQLRDTTDIDWIRTNAAHRLRQLDAMDGIDALNAISESFTRRHGRPPASWPELAADQRWRGIPTDPTGEVFALDPATGKVSLGANSKLHPLPDGSSVSIRK